MAFNFEHGHQYNGDNVQMGNEASHQTLNGKIKNKNSYNNYANNHGSFSNNYAQSPPSTIPNKETNGTSVPKPCIPSNSNHPQIEGWNNMNHTPSHSKQQLEGINGNNGNNNNCNNWNGGNPASVDDWYYNNNNNSGGGYNGGEQGYNNTNTKNNNNNNNSNNNGNDHHQNGNSSQNSYINNVHNNTGFGSSSNNNNKQQQPPKGNEYGINSNQNNGKSQLLPMPMLSSNNHQNKRKRRNAVQYDLNDKSNTKQQSNQQFNSYCVEMRCIEEYYANISCKKRGLRFITLIYDKNHKWSCLMRSNIQIIAMYHKQCRFLCIDIEQIPEIFELQRIDALPTLKCREAYNNNNTPNPLCGLYFISDKPRHFTAEELEHKLYQNNFLKSRNMSSSTGGVLESTHNIAHQGKLLNGSIYHQRNGGSDNEDMLDIE